MTNVFLKNYIPFVKMAQVIFVVGDKKVKGKVIMEQNFLIISVHLKVQR